MRPLKESIRIGRHKEKQYAYFERDSAEYHCVSEDGKSETITKLTPQQSRAVKCLLEHSQDVEHGWVHKSYIYRAACQEEPPKDSEYTSRFSKVISELNSILKGYDGMEYFVKWDKDSNYYKIFLLELPFEDYESGEEFLRENIDNYTDIECIDICSHTGSYLLNSVYVKNLFKNIPFRIIINHPDAAKTIIKHFKHNDDFGDINELIDKWKKNQSKYNGQLEIRISQIPFLHHYICIHKKKNKSIALLTFYTYGVDLENHYRETYMEDVAKFALFNEEFEELWRSEETHPITDYSQSKKEM